MANKRPIEIPDDEEHTREKIQDDMTRQIALKFLSTDAATKDSKIQQLEKTWKTTASASAIQHAKVDRLIEENRSLKDELKDDNRKFRDDHIEEMRKIKDKHNKVIKNYKEEVKLAVYEFAPKAKEQLRQKDIQIQDARRALKVAEDSRKVLLTENSSQKTVRRENTTQKARVAILEAALGRTRAGLAEKEENFRQVTAQVSSLQAQLAVVAGERDRLWGEAEVRGLREEAAKTVIKTAVGVKNMTAPMPLENMGSYGSALKELHSAVAQCERQNKSAPDGTEEPHAMDCVCCQSVDKDESG